MTVTDAAAEGEPTFDPDELRDKYRQERDKRIREDGNEQYIEVSGLFASYVEDPYIDQPIERLLRGRGQ